MSDLISRQKAIREIDDAEVEVWEAADADYNRGLDDAKIILEALPSADRPTGEWMKRQIIGGVSFAYCSECGEPILHGRTSPLWNYCPNCGAWMGGEYYVKV